MESTDTNNKKDERHKKRMVIDYSQTVNRCTHLDAYPVPRIDEQINNIAKAKYYSFIDLKSAYYQVPLAKEDREFTAFEANGKLYHYCRMPFGVENGVSPFQRIINNMIEKYSLKRIYAYLDNVTVTGVDKNEHANTIQNTMENVWLACVLRYLLIVEPIIQENVASSVSVEKKTVCRSSKKKKQTQIALILRRLKTRKSKYFS